MGIHSGDKSIKISYLHDFFSCLNKKAFLSRKRIPLATLLVYTVCVNMNYNYLTTIYRSIYFRPNVQISGRKIYINNFDYELFKVKVKNC